MASQSSGHRSGRKKFKLRKSPGRVPGNFLFSDCALCERSECGEQAASYSRKCLHFREIVTHMEYVSYDGLFQYTMVLLTVVGVVIAFMNIKKK
jgi:hypothetical protein